MNLIEILVADKKRNDVLVTYKGVLLALISLKSLMLVLNQVLLLI